MNTRVINEFHDVFVASRAAFPLEGRKLGLEELLDYPIMMLDRKSTTSEFLHQIFQKRQLDLVPEIELSSNDLLIDLARIGLGIAFVPDFCIPAKPACFPGSQTVHGYPVERRSLPAHVKSGSRTVPLPGPHCTG